MLGQSSELLRCYHCANTATHQKIGSYTAKELFEHIDGARFSEDFDYEIYQCSTCSGISIHGDFVRYPRAKNLSSQRIYPRGSLLLPDVHTVASDQCVARRVLQLYEEIWPRRHVSPSAFAAQVRRVLEFICLDQKAHGGTLFQQLKNLVASGVFPGYFAEMTDLMRQVGNLGAHASDEEIDFWDAELLDDFLRSVVEYVYIAPSKIERLKQRMSLRAF